MPFSNGTEVQAIKTMREDGDLLLSLVMVQDDEVIGHIAFSPVTLGDRASGSDGWIGLGPVSIAPERQREGWGNRLVSDGLARMRQHGKAGCVLIGNPAYYSRFGFRNDGRITYRGLSAELVQWLSFGDAKPEGELVFCRGLEEA